MLLSLQLFKIRRDRHALGVVGEREKEREEEYACSVVVVVCMRERDRQTERQRGIITSISTGVCNLDWSSAEQAALTSIKRGR